MAQHVQTCHWSVPTILMPRPFWLSAGESPWCCWNERDVRVLTSTTECESCPMWKPREVEHAHEGAIPPKGAMTAPVDRLN
jgi:hypothetical protein